jgi:hypothetical protein
LNASIKLLQIESSRQLNQCLYRIFLVKVFKSLAGQNWFITKSNWALSAFGNPVILPLAFIFVDPIPLT